MSENKVEKEKFRITLDRPDHTYIAGETINGEIWFNLEKRTKFRGIKVELRGKGKCKWMEILRKSSSADGARGLFYSGKAIYEQSVRSLPVFEPHGAELKAGEHRFPFSTSIALTDPSSFKGNYGSIKYKLVIVVQKPWQFDERHRIPIHIIKCMPLSIYYRPSSGPLTKQVTKTISLFGTKPISLLAILPEDYVVRGEQLKVCVNVCNNSNTNIEKLRFTILQLVTYISSQPLTVIKKESYIIASKETGSIQKKSERSFAHAILVPQTAQPTDTDLSWCINIEYKLRIEAVLRGLFKNIVLDMPFKLYSHEMGGEPRRSVSREAVNNTNVPGNPFETASIHSSQTITSSSNVNNLTYPNLERTCTSPTYSSQYSESSSMTSSIASDSSTATLSPATGAINISYNSASSSLYNSPSTRASLCSNNAAHMPYGATASMYNSYPPANYQEPSSYRLSDAQQAHFVSATNMPTSDAEATSTPTVTRRRNDQRTSVSALPAVLPTRLSQMPTDLPTRLSQLPSTSAYSFLQPRPPPEAHELPPSYEELFGNASAPPLADIKNPPT